MTFAYDQVLPNATTAGESIMRHAFPITPQRLGEGFIVGRERVLTKSSSAVAPMGYDGALCVRTFDRDGWQTGTLRGVAAPANVSLPADGAAFAVVVPDDDCDSTS